MQKVLVDLFSVPEEARASFLETARTAQGIVKTIPGFVEGYMFEQKDGESRYNFLTTAVWESEEAYENAKRTVIAEYQQKGFNPQETLKTLNVDLVRSTYERSAY